MQNSKKNSSFHIKLELPVRQMVAEDLPNLQPLPQSVKNQSRADFLSRSMDLSFPGQDQKDLFGKPGQGAHQSFDIPFGLNLIHTAKGRNDPLDGFFPLSAVFNNAMRDVGSKLHNLLVYLVWNEGIFLARMLQKSKGRFLKKIYPPGRKVRRQMTDDG
jgi:hypothetical protein